MISIFLSLLNEASTSTHISIGNFDTYFLKVGILSQK